MRPDHRSCSPDSGGPRPRQTAGLRSRSCFGRAGRSSRRAALAAALLAAGCGSSVRLPAGLSASDGASVKPHALRYRREVGSPDRYRASYGIRVRNGHQRDEDVTAEILLYTTGKTSGPDVFDRVLIRCSEEKRNLVEIDPKGKRTVKSRTRDAQPLITPNFEAEPGTKGLYYVPFDELGQIGRRKQTPYHYAWLESLCYFFPVFPEKLVLPGDRWEYQMPVVVGRTFSNNVVPLHVIFEFSGLKELPGDGGAGVPCALIDYTYWALLDTDMPAHASKLPKDAPGLVWRRNVVEGKGRAYFDITRGKVVWKREGYRIVLDAKTRRPDEKPKERSPALDFLFGPAKKAGEPGVDRHYRTVTVEFSARRLAPGERSSAKPSRVD